MPRLAAIIALGFTLLTSGCLTKFQREPRVLPPVADAAPKWLEQRVRDQALAAAPHVQQLGPIHQDVTCEEGAVAEWSVHLDAERCYLISGMGDDGVERLNLYVINEKGKTFAQNGSRNARNVVRACPEFTGLHRIRAKSARGRGHLGVGVFAEPKQVSSSINDTLAQEVEAEAAAVAPGASRMGQFFTGTTRTSEWFVALEKGKCYWWVGIAEESISKFSLYLWDSANKRLKENRASARKASLGHCPKAAGMYKFQAKILQDSGNYAVGLYEK